MFELVALFSLLLFVGSPVVIPWIVIRLPEDYFTHAYRQRVMQQPRWMSFIKNIVGSFLIVMGVAMPVLPGQGILTIFVGLMLTGFPGKYKLEQWLIHRHSVLHLLNWVRAKAGKKPLRVS